MSATKAAAPPHPPGASRRVPPSPPLGAERVGVRWGGTDRGDYAVFCSLRPSSLIVCSRIMNFCTLPVTVIGKASTNFT
jgi:hypothetical protein